MLKARLWDIAPALVTWLVTRQLLDHPWQLAFLSAVAVYALGYSARRTVTNLRRIHNEKQEPLFVRVSPGEEAEGRDQE